MTGGAGVRGDQATSHGRLFAGAVVLAFVLGCPKQAPLTPKVPAATAKDNDSDDRSDPKDVCTPKAPDGAAWNDNDGCPGLGAGGSRATPSRKPGAWNVLGQPKSRWVLPEASAEPRLAAPA